MIFLQDRVVDRNGDDLPKSHIWRRLVAGAAALAVMLSGAMLSQANAAVAASPGITSVAWIHVSDGTLPFDATVAPGNDTGDRNFVVRAQDSVSWQIAYTADAAGTAAFVATLPAGMRWTAASANATVCTGPGGGSINPAGNVLTCNRNYAAGEVAQLPVSAVVGAMGNGATIAPVVTVSGETFTSNEPVTVSATPKTKLAIYTQPAAGNVPVGDGLGVSIAGTGFFGTQVDPANPSMFGLEALSDSFTFTLQVPPGAVMTRLAAGTGGGSYSYTQTAPGQPISITATGVNTTYLNAVSASGTEGLTTPPDAANARVAASFAWTIVIPYEGYVPENATTQFPGRFMDFDPDSLSGQSNFGTDYAPGQEPGYVCPVPTTVGPTAACFVASFTLATGSVRGASVGGSSNAGLTDLMYGDDDNFTRGNEPTVVGQPFSAFASVYNADSAGSPLTGARGSQTWDPTKLELAATPTLRLVQGASSSSFTRHGQVNSGTIVPSSDYTLEYTDFNFASDADRRARDSFADAALTWVSDPATLSGGLASVTSYRVMYHGELAPGITLGFVTPFKRAAASADLPTGSSLPWFWQFGDDSGLVKSNYTGTGASSRGGYVQTASALFRAKATWLKVDGASYPAGSAERGDLVTLNIAPVVVGPVDAPDSVLEDAKVTVTMPNACVEPVESALPPIPHSFTPGVPGGNCATGTPAVITFTYGDLVAAGGAAGPSPFDGHATNLPALQFPVKVSMGTPVPSTLSAVVVTSSPSDPSLLQTNATSRTNKAALTVSGAASFKVAKSATTVRPGFVGPGETMNYTISWANASATTFGESSFVDVLPFEGDSRGTEGLGGKLIELRAVSAAMDDAAQGTVRIEYTTDPGLSVQTAVATPGNENAATGVNWATYSGTLPNGVTALRFTPSEDMLPSYAGTATLEVKVPSLARQGNVNNNVALRLIAASGSNIVQTAGAARPLQSAAALVEGNVYRDLDFSGDRSASDAAWPAGSQKVALSQAGAVVATADIAADGTFAFPLVAAGTYELRLAADSEDGWLLLNEADSSFTVEPEGTHTVELLYQEILADTTLSPTSVIVAQGAQSDSVRIAELDELGLPQAPGSVFEADTVEIVDGPQYGTAQLVPGSDLSDIVYSAASDWPAEFAGQASYEETVTYSWTNALGVVSTSTLTVTVRQGLVAVDDEFRTGDHESNLDVLANDVGVDLSLSGTPTTSADATVSVVNGKLRVIPTHVWAGDELEYEVPVRYTVADWNGDTATATATVLVQRAPFGANQQAVIGQVGEHVFSEQVQSAGTIVSRVQVGLTPVGTVELGDGTVKFSTGGVPVAAGTYPITIQYTDDLGQTSNVVYTVIVLGAPQATGGTATVQQGGSHTFGNPLVSESDSIITDIVQPTQGNVSIGTNGDVTFSAGTAARGDYAFTVTYTDEFGQAATANFVVTVQGSFSVVGETTATIRQNGEHTFSPVVTTDAPLTAVTVVDAPAAGALTVDEGTGVVTFDADSIAPGTYDFGVEYENGDGQTILVTYTVTVQAKLQVAGESRKVAVGGTIEFTENITTTGSIVSREVIEEPTSGEVILGSVRFDAADAAPGTYTFIVRYTDNVGQTADATFEAIVQAAPTAEDINVTVPFGTTTVTVDPLGAVDGVGLQDLIVANVGQPQSGSTVLSPTGMVVFTPPIGFSGTVTFFTTVSDDLGQTVLVKTQITVEPDGSTGGGDTDNGNGDNSSDGQGGNTSPGQDNQVTAGNADKGLAITGSGDAVGSLYLIALLFAVGIIALGFGRRRRQN